MRLSRLALFTAALVAGCNSAGRGIGTLHDGGGGAFDAALGAFDMSFPPVQPAAVVYAHSADTLFSVDPDTLAVTKIAAFVWPTFIPDTMTDIALDKDGNMIGISADNIYSVDKSNARCSYLASWQGSGFNGLSFISADQIDANGEEILVGASQNGDVYRVDPMNGAQTKIGSYGAGFGSSGDLVSVAGATYATVTKASSGSDVLVKVNPMNGVATVIGATGVSGIWGLGYWKQKLFGFTSTNDFVLIDINSGVATQVKTSSASWYGAGVTTAAPTTVN